MKSGLIKVVSDYEITKESLTSHLSMANDSFGHLRPDLDSTTRAYLPMLTQPGTELTPNI